MKADEEGSPAESGIPLGTHKMFFANQRAIMQHTSIRVGQRLINWDGIRGYVAQNSQGKGVFGPGESFLVEWLGLDGNTIEDSAYYTLEALEEEQIRFGRGVMPWAK
jgi:hypothetical protein